MSILCNKNPRDKESNFNKTLIEMSEREIKELKRFWKDLHWYEREFAINIAINYAKNASKSVIKSEKIPEDITKRCKFALTDLETLKVSNNKEKPSKIALKMYEFKSKIGLINKEERDISPNLRICLASIPYLSKNELAELENI